MSEFEFEDELRRTQPAPVSDTLRRAVAADMALSESPSQKVASGVLRRGPAANGASRFLFRIAFALGAAALLACAIVGLRPQVEEPSFYDGGMRATPSTGPAVTALLPVESSRELIDAGDEEFLFPESQAPAVRVRLRSVERHAWADAQGGALIAVEVPREDIVLIPVSMQ
jgi:hypothetical protein